MARFISASRPTTGGNSPELACCVRSVAYRESSGYVALAADADWPAVREFAWIDCAEARSPTRMPAHKEATSDKAVTPAATRLILILFINIVLSSEDGFSGQAALRGRQSFGNARAVLLSC